MILFIKHIDIEGPETIGAFFAQRGYASNTIDLSMGESLPGDLSNIEAVICLGGPMNVYEEDKHLYLREENSFIQKVLEQEIPFLGICLGSQLLAKACGAKVSKSPKEEIGWSHVQLTDEGKDDELFAGVIDPLMVFQWHGDTFAVPKEGTLLATFADCPNQAFRVGPSAYGVQFHVEITDKSIREWSDRYFKDNNVREQKKTQMLNEYEQKQQSFDEAAYRIYENFLGLVSKRKINVQA